jgi:hypothetical protein
MCVINGDLGENVAWHEESGNGGGIGEEALSFNGNVKISMAAAGVRRFLGAGLCMRGMPATYHI